ncbi:hypothetical protein CKAH01_01474 [Colletotrichum kahawae]|uniref:Uncharacterized protein n=1 Tax=Colletotrichum kahawae TaxID=34407 RepID=A0AAD9Y5L0_COLKA|nr:hypothetical protein CKAH01_01474 [Colletotrichum kahawae]
MGGLCADARCCSSAHLLITRPPLALEGPRRRRPPHAHLPLLIIPGDSSGGGSSNNNKKKKAGLAVSVLSVAGQWQRLA